MVCCKSARHWFTAAPYQLHTEYKQISVASATAIWTYDSCCVYQRRPSQYINVKPATRPYAK